MLAPNPLTAAPQRREPWETPADLPAYLMRPHAHRVACELATREIRRAMTAAAAAFTPPVTQVIADCGAAFESFADAARVLATVTDRSEDALWMGIKRACATGKPYCGRRWRLVKRN